jgi:hypothetical protein
MQRTILIGEYTTGKSRAAGLMTMGKSICEVNMRPLNNLRKADIARRLRRILGNARPEDTIVLIDEISKKSLDVVLLFFFEDRFDVEPKMKAPFVWSPEQVILIGSNLTYADIPKGLSYLRRYNIITCKENLDHSIEMIMHHPEEIDPAFNKNLNY